MLKRFVLMLLLLGCLGRTALAEELTAAKHDDVKSLMEVTGSKNIGRQYAAAMIPQLLKIVKASNSEIPDRALAVIEREVVALLSERMSAPGGLIDLVIPIYDKHFTHQEIRELLAFYQTPIGKKTISVMPMVANESMIAGQRWGQSLGPEIENRLKNALEHEGIPLKLE